jgi:hypothetical protein
MCKIAELAEVSLVPEELLGIPVLWRLSEPK